MANPNADIYLTPENWIPCKVLSGTEEGSTGRPKIVNWAENTAETRTGTLGYGAYMQKLVFGEPLDKTICPTGQHPNISIFSEIQEFKNTQDNSTIATPVSVIEHKNAPCNWFIGEETGLLATQFGMIRDRGNANQRWSPNPANDNGANANVNIAPYTTWAIDGMLLRIEVLPVMEWENIGGVMFPKTSSLQWRTLREWKENYSNYPICCIGFVFYGQRSKSETTIMFADNSWVYNESQSITACPLDDLGEYSGEPFYDYAQCAINRTHGFYLMNSYVTEPYNNTASSAYCYGLNHFDGVQIHAISDSTNGWRHCVEIPYSAKNFETIYKMAACFGMCFTDTNKYVFSADYNDDDLFLPVIDNNGISNGEYTHGAANLTNSAAQITDIRTINYDPSANIDTNTYSNTTIFNTISGGANATEKYVLNDSNVRTLLDDLWTISHTLAGADYDKFEYKIKDNFLVTNPIDSIVSLKRFPFNIPHTFSSQKTHVNLGRNQGNSQGYLTYEPTNNIVFRGVNIYPRFENSFLDYAPYTEYELYVPFCGTIKLNAGDILGHTLNCKMCVDLTTGACIAYIMADDLVIETVSGVVSSDLQFSGIDSATADSNIQSAVLNHMQARINKKVSLLSPISIGGGLQGLANPWNYAGSYYSAKTELKRADYNLTHMETPIHSMGNAGGLTGWLQEFNARLMIYYPTGDAVTNEQPPSLQDLSTYAHTTGFATIDNSVLSNYSGFTVATNAILNFAATDTEKEMIANLLQSGVYL